MAGWRHLHSVWAVVEENANIPFIAVKKPRADKLSVDTSCWGVLSRMFLGTWLQECHGGICNPSIHFEQRALAWLGTPQCWATLCVCFNEKKVLLGGDGEGMGSEPGNPASLFSYKDLVGASYYLWWVNLWNNFSEGRLLSSSRWKLIHLALNESGLGLSPIYQHVIKTF